MLHVSTVGGIVSVPERSDLETSRRELSEDVPFGNGTLLAAEQSIELGKPLQGGVMYIVIRDHPAVCALVVPTPSDALPTEPLYVYPRQTGRQQLGLPSRGLCCDRDFLGHFSGLFALCEGLVQICSFLGIFSRRKKNIKKKKKLIGVLRRETKK